MPPGWLPQILGLLVGLTGVIRSVIKPTRKKPQKPRFPQHGHLHAELELQGAVLLLVRSYAT